MMKVVTDKELKESRTWLAIEGKVYDVKDFFDSHPGGPELLQDVVGGDGEHVPFFFFFFFFFFFNFE
jgi:cytochrome b involved in lipid metabolism